MLGTCASCHNGTTAPGKTATHVPSPNTCDDCHNTGGWIPAVFDHSGITGACTTCHNGTIAEGKTPDHIATSSDCFFCHYSTVAWLPVTFDHDAVTGSCSSCHNGITARGKSGSHFGTTLQCDECHNTNNWTPISFTHSSGDYPGDHNSSVTCLDCHQGNSQTATWPSSAYKPDCAGCHAAKFKPDAHKKYEDPDTFYSVSELRDCAGSCHLYTDSSLTTIKKSRTGEHRTSSGGF